MSRILGIERVTDALEACGLLVEWTENCSDETSGALAVDSQSVAACMLQLELFTGESMLTYAQCLHDATTLFLYAGI